MGIEPLDRRSYEPSVDLSPSTSPTVRNDSLRRELNVADYPDYEQPLLASIGECGGAAAAAFVSRPKSAGEKIDALVAAYSGPYTVDGKSVSAPPMFKMALQYPSQTHIRELGGIVGKELAARAQCSQGDPAEIRTATQKLIDAGKLPPGTGDVATRIKQMQWQYGIGIDCASFTHHALRATTGKSDAKLGIEAWDGFRGLDSNPHFSKVSPLQVKEGDVITLDPKPPESVGHNVIVRSAFTTDQYPGMSGTGPYHVITVDSSWGAGDDGRVDGGYRRDTWVYDESTKDWGFYRPRSNDLVISSDGPSDWDKYHGAYRVKP